MSADNDNRHRPIPIPKGGFRTNEDEARWLEKTIVMRAEESLRAIGIFAKMQPGQLYELLKLALDSASKRPTDPEALTVADYEECLADHRRLVRELDVALNGEEGAAKQASLCDIVAQVKHRRWKLITRPTPETIEEMAKASYAVAKEPGSSRTRYFPRDWDQLSQERQAVELNKVVAMLEALYDA